MVDYNKVFDKLLSEISTAQNELDHIQEQLRNQRSIDSVGLEAATIQEETKLWKREAPEGFVEDDEIMYYLAVGQVEQLVRKVYVGLKIISSLFQVKEMRTVKEITRKNLSNAKDTFDSLKKSIKEQV